jgi:hypothetical protein
MENLMSLNSKVGVRSGATSVSEGVGIGLMLQLNTNLAKVAAKTRDILPKLRKIRCLLYHHHKLLHHQPDLLLQMKRIWLQNPVTPGILYEAEAIGYACSQLILLSSSTKNRKPIHYYLKEIYLSNSSSISFFIYY